MAVAEPLRRAFDEIGSILAAEFELAGLFGVDAIVAGDRVWPVEVNPRYTASAEIIERACGAAHRLARGGMQGWHIACGCAKRRGPDLGQSHSDGELVVSPRLAAHLAALPPEHGWEAVADLPLAGSQVLATQPVLTVFAAGPDPAAVAAALQSRLAEVERLIDQHC